MYRVLAQSNPGPVDIGNTFTPAQNFGSMGSLVTVLLRNSFTIAGVIGLVLLIFAGFSVIVSAGSGDSKSLEKGKRALTSVVIGLLLIAGAVWIIQILNTLLGVTLLNTN